MSKLLIFLFPAMLLQYIPKGWYPFQQIDQFYSVIVPGPMDSREKLVNTGTGDLLIHTDFCESNVDSTGNFLYMVHYYQVDSGFYEKDSTELNFRFLELMAEDITHSQNGELIYTHPDQVTDYPAMDYRFSYGPKEIQVKGRLVLTDRYFFNIQAYTLKQNGLNRNMEYFLNSFRPFPGEK